MYNLIQDKLHRVEYHNDTEPTPIVVKVRPFNHEMFYESCRNEIAVAAGRSYENITKAKIWHEQTALRHIYELYQQGKRSEVDFKKYAGETLAIVATLMENERSFAV